MRKKLPILRILLIVLEFYNTLSAQPVTTTQSPHTFEIGKRDFLLDGKPFIIRCGEMHFARVPREYWRHRIQLLHAMGMNAVCAYLFWNYHEWTPGKFDWSGQADAAEFCRIAQEEGMWVILRPGPYVCAEWDGGGLPWWLLKDPGIRLRSQDPKFMAAATSWFKEVGRVLGPMQVSRGGPILMAQVENEYGSYGKDAEYMGKLRQALIDAGFDIPLFVCNPAGDLRNGKRDDLFNVVNFGRDAGNAFARLREVQPTGPLMCGEFYPGWFDTWGSPHHLGNTPKYLEDLEYMLRNGMSFSLYMAHGGTTFGMWSGADRPFKPDTTSYDYDAPVSEAGWTGEKFHLTRNLISKYLQAGEKLHDPPAPLPVMTLPSFVLTETAGVFDNLPASIKEAAPRTMEAYDQGHGCVLYRTQLPPGAAATLKAGQVHDFAWVFVDGVQMGVMDRRSHSYSVALPARKTNARLDILVEAMGHVNFGNEVHDRKGLSGPVTLATGPKTETNVGDEWQIYRLPLDARQLTALKWKVPGAESKKGPGFWRGSFNVPTPADTFLDLSKWGKGVIWINGHCLARFWNIGPTQTAYLPGAWLKAGANEIVIFDLLGPEAPVVAGLEKPILGNLRPELDFANSTSAKTSRLVAGLNPVFIGSFPEGQELQEIRFPHSVTGRQFCIESLNAHDGKPFTAIAELDLLDAAGNSISHLNWKITYVDSEEKSGEDGSASNAIDGQTASYWHTAWKNSQPNHPHQLVIDLGANVNMGGFRYTPRAGTNVTGHIKDYRIYIGDALVKESAK
ncbi:MAG: beta-galactosidase [Chthoniobacteraceae bacterium]